MANKLEIKVAADTGDAQKGIDDLNKSIEQTGKSAADASKDAARSTSIWGESLADVKAALPSPSDARGIEAVGKATLTASRSTAILETTWQRLARNMRTIGRTAGQNLSQGFGGAIREIGRIGLSLGTGLAQAIGYGIRLAGLGTIPAALGVLFGKAAASIAIAAKLGDQYAKAFSKAFATGLELPEFRQFEGLGKALGLSAEQAENFAATWDELAVRFKEGGEAAEKTKGIIAALGGDAAQFGTDAEGMAKGLVSIQEGFKSLETLAQRDVLKNLLPGANDETIAAVGKALNGAKISYEDLMRVMSAYSAEASKQDAVNARIGKSYDALMGTWDRLVAKVAEFSGWNSLVQGLPETLDQITGIIDAWAQSSSFGEIFAQINQDLGRSFEQGHAQIAASIEALNQRLGASYQQGFDQLAAAAKGTFDGIVSYAASVVAAGQAAIVGAWTAVTNAIGSAWEGLKSVISSVVDFAIAQAQRLAKAMEDAWSQFKRFGSSGGSYPTDGSMPQMQRQALPYAMPQVSGLMRGQSSALAGIGLVTPYAAANDNMGAGGIAGLRAEIDRLLYGTKALGKELETTGTKGQTAGQQIAASMAKAAVSTAGVGDAADLAGIGMRGLGTDADMAFQSLMGWAEGATSSLIDAALAGEDMKKVLADLLKELAKMVLMEAIWGDNGLASFFKGGKGVKGASLNTTPFTAAMAGPAPNSLFRSSPSQLSGLSNIAGRTAANDQVGGTINNTSVGDVSVAVMAPENSVTASTEDGKKLGNMIAKTVQAVLINESKPGGLLRRVQ